MTCRYKIVRLYRSGARFCTRLSTIIGIVIGIVQLIHITKKLRNAVNDTDSCQYTCTESTPCLCCLLFCKI